jgi:hypothetical protein
MYYALVFSPVTPKKRKHKVIPMLTTRREEGNGNRREFSKVLLFSLLVEQDVYNAVMYDQNMHK